MRTILAALLFATVTAACAADDPWEECGVKVAPTNPDQCECLGAIVRPSPGPAATCEPGEEHLSDFAYGIEGAACCLPDDPVL